jgi:hypothetical protein
MKHASEGFLTRGGEVGASVLLVGLTTLHRADLWHLSLLSLCVAGGWVVVLGWLAQAYGPALSRSLDALLRPGRPIDPRVDDDQGLAVPELAKMLRSGDERHVLFALDELTSADPERARREAARLVRHPSPTVRARARREVRPVRAVPPLAAEQGWLAAHPVLQALRSGDLGRARSACEAIVAARDRRAVPVLLEAVHGPTRGLVLETLTALGDAAAGALGDALADTTLPPRLRRDLAIVLGRIGTPTSLAQLTRVRHDDPRALRALALRGLDAARKRGDVRLVVDEDAVREAIRADVLELQERRSQRGSLAAATSPDLFGLLPRALDEAIAHARERVFRRLALLYPAREMLRAHRGLASGDERIGAFALEYLEATLTPGDREDVLPVLRAAELTLRPADDVLRTLASDDDTWLATLALHAIGLRRVAALRPVVDAATDGDPIRQETARWALARL